MRVQGSGEEGTAATRLLRFPWSTADPPRLSRGGQRVSGLQRREPQPPLPAPLLSSPLPPPPLPPTAAAAAAASSSSPPPHIPSTPRACVSHNPPRGPVPFRELRERVDEDGRSGRSGPLELERPAWRTENGDYLPYLPGPGPAASGVASRLRLQPRPVGPGQLGAPPLGGGWRPRRLRVG